jgi:uncharacterized DUF497 family protein
MPKARPNLAKHGVDFRDAIGALADPRRIEDFDRSLTYGEERIRTIGHDAGQRLVRCYNDARRGALPHYLSPEGYTT